MSRVEEKRRGVLLLPSIEGEVGRDGHTLGTKAQGALGDGVRKNILFLQTGRSGLGIELGLRGSGHSCKWSNKDNIKLILVLAGSPQRCLVKDLSASSTPFELTAHRSHLQHLPYI